MLFHFTFRIISSITAFLYPGYASYKTLSQRPASEAELERWLMYWSVLGCIIAVEYIAEWAISWIPFYYTLKTLFLLFLALPQTQGATFIYTTLLQPFFHEHESEIDRTIASFKARGYVLLQNQLRRAWAYVAQAIGQAPPGSFAPVPNNAAANAGAPPTMNDPVSGPAQMLGSFWRNYGPSIVASGAAFMQSAQAAAAAPPRRDPALDTPDLSTRPSASSFRQPSSQSVVERRRQLEAELASLSKEPAPYDVGEAAPSMPIPQPSGSVQIHSSGSSGSLRERTTSNPMHFEDIDVPSDAEGYDTGSGLESGPEGTHPPSAARRTSWFGWGGPAQQGYQRVKSD
ncbi:receptor expression-enhancing protein 4 [Punctularia strigosozonata HHB-11173 SS5]|uniref:receptor expression-enhancing protein 4 n=1 Tax=Punctularia strigosozonata (strain HHB-11173) TaxID=741275 RepID=UPI0004417AC7|nr:receptor expression-enhancing protein 4 [Punctularia strigosozonata HHB-11173 SS5]EIN14559.1 receptor expression-enhancing protein 4 [Punctularia strigosozonata HHB-11173 SS5]